MPYASPTITDIGKNTPAAGSAASSVSFTTSQLTPVGSKIVLFVGWFDTAATTCTGATAVGSTTFAVDTQIASGSAHMAMVYGDVAADIAGSSTLTANFSAATPDSRYISGVYLLGVKDGAPNNNHTNNGGVVTVWNAGGAQMRQQGITVGGCYADTGNTITNAPSGIWTEMHDFNIAADSAMCTEWARVTTGSPNVAGTWSANTINYAAVGANYFADELFVPLGMPKGV